MSALIFSICLIFGYLFLTWFLGALFGVVSGRFGEPIEKYQKELTKKSQPELDRVYDIEVAGEKQAIYEKNEYIEGRKEQLAPRSLIGVKMRHWGRVDELRNKAQDGFPVSVELSRLLYGFLLQVRFFMLDWQLAKILYMLFGRWNIVLILIPTILFIFFLFDYMSFWLFSVFVFFFGVPVSIFLLYHLWRRNRISLAFEKADLRNKLREPPTLKGFSYLWGDYCIRTNGLAREDLTEKRLEGWSRLLKLRAVDVLESKRLDEVIIRTAKEILPEMLIYNQSGFEKLNPEPESIYLGYTGIDHLFFPINKAPHMIIAGTSGYGKSCMLRLMLYDFLRRNKQSVSLLAIDMKAGIEMSTFEKYLANGVVIDNADDSVQVITDIYIEMERRLALFRQEGVKNLDSYRKKTGLRIKRIVLVVDELADLYEDLKDMEKQQKKDGEKTSLAKLRSVSKRSRAAGINLILATQKVDSKSIDTGILAQCGLKMSFKQKQMASSILIVGSGAAFYLPDLQGRGVLEGVGTKSLYVQIPYVSEEEIEGLLNKYCSVKKEKPVVKEESKIQVEERESRKPKPQPKKPQEPNSGFKADAKRFAVEHCPEPQGGEDRAQAPEKPQKRKKKGSQRASNDDDWSVDW